MKKYIPYFGLVFLLILASCTHDSSTLKYKKMYASLFSSPNFINDADTINYNKNGFVIEGNLQDMPNNLIVLLEYTPENVIFIDSARTDGAGNFRMNAIISEEKICYFQFGEKQGFPTAINNKSKMKLNVKAMEEGLNFQISGTNISTALQIKSLIEINSGYNYKLKTLQMQAMGYDPTISTPQQIENAKVEMIATQKEMHEAIVAEMLKGEPSFAPYFALKYLLQNPDYDAIVKGYDKCALYQKNSVYTEILKEWAAQERGTAIGYPAADISQKTPEGKILTLSSLKGKVVLIDFWASWCGPCMRVMPELKDINAKYKGQAFAILGVSLDRDSNSWANTIKSSGLDWLHISDLKYWSNAGAKAYGVSGIPATFLIDKDGNIAAKNLHGDELNAKIAELIAKPRTSKTAKPINKK